MEVAADALAAPEGLDRLAPLLQVLGDRPLLVHPGPTAGQEAIRPSWWTPTVEYTAQLNAAWWAWADGGRARFPRYRCASWPSVASAHCTPAPARPRRRPSPVDPLVFVETSSYATRAVDAVLRVLGVDVICYGSDSPYAQAAELDLDPAARRAITDTNPARLLAGATQKVSPT